MRALVNAHARPEAVAAPSRDARAFHTALDGYAPTPLRDLAGVAGELGLAGVSLKDESARLGLPAFKVLGASWAAERALCDAPGIHTLVTASAGNHGRAVARVAALRGLHCLVLVPRRAAPARRAAIAAEGSDVVVVDGTYEDACALAAQAAQGDRVLELADVGESPPARWVVDGYATLFAEIEQPVDVLLVPVGVGSLAAAAARFGAHAGTRVIGVEPATAACLTASLAAGGRTAVPTPGTSMAGMDCAEVSAAAWPTLRDGIHGTVTVGDGEVHDAMRELGAAGLRIGDCGAAPLAALRALMTDPACVELRVSAGLGPQSRVLLVATEGPTNPDAYTRVIELPGASLRAAGTLAGD